MIRDCSPDGILVSKVETLLELQRKIDVLKAPLPWTAMVHGYACYSYDPYVALRHVREWLLENPDT